MCTPPLDIDTFQSPFIQLRWRAEGLENPQPYLESFVSILVPQIVLDGFLGVRARCDGIEIDPRLPADWPEVTVNRVAFQRLVLTITAGKDRITISGEGRPWSPVFVYPPANAWKVAVVATDGKVFDEKTLQIGAAGPGVPLTVGKGRMLRLTRS